ncbi:MAG: ABC transporter substrate-binding protein [Candidatus Omnitrophota bacterium]|jgi:iron complex transport system substrate-binding protein
MAVKNRIIGLGVIALFIYLYGIYGLGSVCAQGSYPQRIISLGPSTTEELYLLGVEDRIVGVTRYCTRPSRAVKKEKVGAVVEVNLEKVVSLRPDLVLATTLTDPKTVTKLKDMGIKVITIAPAKDFIQICQQLLQLGDLVGKRGEAEDIVRQARKEAESVRNRIEKLPRVPVFVQVGAKPLVTANRDSFINNLIELAGGENIVENSAELSYMPYSREKVLEADPDYIVIVTMGLAGEEEKTKWESFKEMKAVKNKNIRVIDAYDICSLTPVTFVETLKDIAGMLHPVEGEGGR